MPEQTQTGHGATLTFTPQEPEDNHGENILSTIKIISMTPPAQSCETIDLPHLGMAANTIIPKMPAAGIDGGELQATVTVNPELDWEKQIGSVGVTVLTYPAPPPHPTTGAIPDSQVHTFYGIFTSYTPGALESTERMTAEITIAKANDAAITTVSN
tara:strand:+ start:351 stop:821 length:471 start_codon:yes stop_codon:yes gene_type:complete